MVSLAFKIIDPGDVGHVGLGERAHRTDNILSRGGYSSVSLDSPALRRFIVAGILDPSIELNIPSEVELVRDIFQIVEHRSLVRLRLFPIPFLHHLVGEGVAVERAARSVDSCAWISVVPPCSADVACPVINPN